MLKNLAQVVNAFYTIQNSVTVIKNLIYFIKLIKVQDIYTLSLIAINTLKG